MLDDGVAGGIHEREGVGTEFQGDGPGLTGLDEDAVEGTELLAGPDGGGQRVDDVELDHLVAVAGTGIFHLDRHFDIRNGARNRESGVLEGRVTEAVSEGIQRIGGHFHIVVAARILLVVIDRELAYVPGNAHREASGRVVIAEEDVGEGRTAFAAGIPHREEGVGLLRGPVLVQRTAFHIYDDDRLAGGLDGPQEFVLQAQELQRGPVEAFAGLHVGNGLFVHHGRAGVDVLGLEIAGGRASDHDDGHIGKHRRNDRLGDLAVPGVPDGAALDIADIGPLGLQALKHRDHVVLRLRGGVVAELVVLVVRIRADEGDAGAL